MEYRFSMTPRLVALAVLCLIALMVLMFLLGENIGRVMATSSPGAQVSRSQAMPNAAAVQAEAGRLRSAVGAGALSESAGHQAPASDEAKR
jgi:hypothetical protein